MIVTAENVRLIGCRTIDEQDGTKKTFGNIYTLQGDLLSFSADFEVEDSLKPITATFDIAWGSGKNGKWHLCKLLK